MIYLPTEDGEVPIATAQHISRLLWLDYKNDAIYSIYRNVCIMHCISVYIYIYVIYTCI